MNNADGFGVGSAYVGGVLTGVGRLAMQTGFSWAKAVPVAGYVVNGIATAHDIGSAAGDYQKCMAGK